MGYTDGANVASQIQHGHMQAAIKHLMPFWNLTAILKLRSREAVSLFQDRELRFVYVDARHDYCAVLEDLRLYWPKVKPGGVMAGDDYFVANANSVGGWCEDGTFHPGGVKQAVEDFAVAQGLVLRIISANWLSRELHPRPQWWFLNPLD